MQHNPFTLDEANEIAEDFEDLVDTEINTGQGKVYVIHNVVVCPFDEPGKQLFADNYRKTKDKNELINFHKGDEYDVVIFAYDADDEADYNWFDIRTFAERRGIKYNFPG